MLFRSNDTATTEIYTTLDTLSLHDALPISASPNFGLLLDSWLQPIRYSVTQVFSPTPPPNTVMLFTAPGEMRSNILAAPPIAPDLVVCTTSAGAVPATPACGPGVPSFQTPAVVYSTGKNFPLQLPAEIGRAHV